MGKAASTAWRSAALSFVRNGRAARRRASRQPCRELAAHAGHLVEGAAIQLQWANDVLAHASRLGFLKQVDEIYDFGAAFEPGRAPPSRTTRGARGMSRSEIKRGGQAGRVAYAARVALDDQPGQPRVDGQSRHPAADVASARRAIDGAQADEQLAGDAHAAAGGGSSQASASASRDAQRRQRQRQLGESARAISG